MTYDPAEYWNERGRNYSVSVDTTPELKNLADLIVAHNIKGKVLEVGSGYGRIYQYLADRGVITWEQFTMCDIANSMRYRCMDKTGILPDYWDGKQLPYEYDEFELVISFSVFLHVPPVNFWDVLLDHVRVCNRFFYIATYNGGDDGQLAKHCFQHDYTEAFKRLTVEVKAADIFMDGLRVNWLLEMTDK